MMEFHGHLGSPQPCEGHRLIIVSVEEVISNQPRLTKVVPKNVVYCAIEEDDTDLGLPLVV